MPESKSTASKSSTASKAEEKPAVAKAGPLARASESADAGVQNLLAEYGIADLNDDDEAREDVDRRLADLGYRR
jgi:hypothetical protein